MGITYRKSGTPGGKGEGGPIIEKTCDFHRT